MIHFVLQRSLKTKITSQLLFSRSFAALYILCIILSHGQGKMLDLHVQGIKGKGQSKAAGTTPTEVLRVRQGGGRGVGLGPARSCVSDTTDRGDLRRHHT